MDATDVLKREEKLQQVERILHSRAMRGSENLKSFLRFVAHKSIDQSTDQLKEYTIATEVFGRSNDFSPRIDSVVRVQASRLRSKLQEYYENEGKSDRIVIELPKGHYCPAFSVNAEVGRFKPSAESARVPNAEETGVRGRLASAWTASTSRSTWSISVLGSLILVLGGLVFWLRGSNANLSNQLREGRPENRIQKLGPVWQTFLQDNDPTILVLSNPAVYRFTNPKDTDASLQNSVTLSPNDIKYVNRIIGEKFMIKHNAGRLVLCTDEYTGMGEAIGLARITRLFASVDKGALLRQSRAITPEDLKNHNIILLGSTWVNDWSGKLPIFEDFAYTSTATIENLKPQPGEKREYDPVFDAAGRLIEDYGLITVKPNILSRNTVMVIAGIHSEGTEAAAEYVTNPEYLSGLTDRLRQLSEPAGPPKYYQALLRVDVDHGMPTTISLIALHVLSAQTN